jgi:transcription termination factor Rho
VDELNASPFNELLRRSDEMNLRVNPEKTRHHLVFDLLRTYGSLGTQIFAEGVIELSQNGNTGFLRWPRFNFKTLPQDIFVPAQFINQYGLRNGNCFTARIRMPRDHRERNFVVDEVLTIEAIPVADWKETPEFEKLTAMHPSERIVLENLKLNSVTARAIDLIAPLGHGQRGLIIAPPRVGKTVMLKEIAKAISANQTGDTKLILLLIDERPEEVTDFRRSLTNCEIYSSTFDESPQRHTQVAELVSDRAKRLVELRKKVVILLDSITRLSRGYNNLMPGKGRLMSGGVDSKALIKPKKFFSAARNTEEGGALTVLASCLVETNSKPTTSSSRSTKGQGTWRSASIAHWVTSAYFPRSISRSPRHGAMTCFITRRSSIVSMYCASNSPRCLLLRLPRCLFTRCVRRTRTRNFCLLVCVTSPARLVRHA